MNFRGPKGLPITDRCLVMGIVNTTPDSFSDGGDCLDPARAVERGLALVAAGADIVDVGGESTRPAARRVPESVELERVLPVVRGLAASGAVVSVDAMPARVAAAAVEAGASLVNDVSGGLADPDMAPVVAEADVPYVATRWRGHSTHMQKQAHYDDVVAEVMAELGGRLAVLVDAGVHPDRVVLDPGLGFAKTAEHNWEILRRLDEVRTLGRPLLVGASRKSFLGALLARDGTPPPPVERDRATAAVSTQAAASGVWCVRVHDVASTADAVRVARQFTHFPSAHTHSTSLRKALT
ncbi:dihydropteroate synthase [Streptomyces capitiformicae]|uniref:Dihydropteroate synthase n=2 Tax=Streptomyces capitiformicae TaxID=2014920 RepID=A0A919DI86_9ACTN|nr:dihydropteroate synthase [Streptomyces capitiformicae]GHE46966.1 dihydropteroate synthase [Streptomyces capitiformicae]